MTIRRCSVPVVLVGGLLALAGLSACDESDPTPTPSTSLEEEQEDSPAGSGVGGIAPRQTDFGDSVGTPGTGSTP